MTRRGLLRRSDLSFPGPCMGGDSRRSGRLVRLVIPHTPLSVAENPVRVCDQKLKGES